jgi:hypothetical protein
MELAQNPAMQHIWQEETWDSSGLIDQFMAPLNSHQILD